MVSHEVHVLFPNSVHLHMLGCSCVSIQNTLPHELRFGMQRLDHGNGRHEKSTQHKKSVGRELLEAMIHKVNGSQFNSLSVRNTHKGSCPLKVRVLTLSPLRQQTQV